MSWDQIHQVETSAGVVEYAEQGSGPPVVLLHGLPMNHTQWDAVLPLLPGGFRYLRPVLPFGGHRRPLAPDADLSVTGVARLLAEILDLLDLDDVTLVHSDCGAGLFLTARGLDHRVGSQIVLSCEAFDNFPPGLAGQVAALAARAPGGLVLAAHELRVGWLRRLPILFGHMSRRPLDDDLVRGWTEHLLADRGVRRDLRRYAGQRFDAPSLIADTEALADFTGDVLVLWSRDDRLMPPEHGRRLAGLIPGARLVEVPDAYVLSMLDQPEFVAREMGAFLTRSPTAER